MDRQSTQTAFVPLLRRDALRRLGHFGPHYFGPARRDVLRRVAVGVRRMAARATAKLGLTSAVCLIAVTASVACATGVARVHEYDRHAVQLSLVRHIASQLKKRPSADLRSLTLAEPSPSEDARQIFKGDSASGVFRAHHEGFRNTVVLVLPESGFLSPEPLLRPSRVLARTALLPVRCFAPEASARPEQPSAHFLDRLAAERLSIGSGREIHDTKIDTEKFGDVDRRVLGYVDGGVQVEATITLHEIDLTFDPVESLALVLTVDHRDDHPARARQDRGRRRPFEREASLVVGDRSVRTEARCASFGRPKNVDGLPDSTHRQLCGQSEPLAKFGVAQLVDRRLAKGSGPEANAGRVCRSSVKGSHHVAQRGSLIGLRQQLQLKRQLHAVHSIAERIAPQLPSPGRATSRGGLR